VLDGRVREWGGVGLSRTAGEPANNSCCWADPSQPCAAQARTNNETPAPLSSPSRPHPRQPTSAAPSTFARRCHSGSLCTMYLNRVPSASSPRDTDWPCQMRSSCGSTIRWQYRGSPMHRGGGQVAGAGVAAGSKAVPETAVGEHDGCLDGLGCRNAIPERPDS